MIRRSVAKRENQRRRKQNPTRHGAPQSTIATQAIATVAALSRSRRSGGSSKAEARLTTEAGSRPIERPPGSVRPRSSMDPLEIDGPICHQRCRRSEETGPDVFVTGEGRVAAGGGSPRCRTGWWKAGAGRRPRFDLVIDHKPLPIDVSGRAVHVGTIIGRLRNGGRHGNLFDAQASMTAKDSGHYLPVHDMPPERTEPLMSHAEEAKISEAS